MDVLSGRASAPRYLQGWLYVSPLPNRDGGLLQDELQGLRVLLGGLPTDAAGC